MELTFTVSLTTQILRKIRSVHLDGIGRRLESLQSLNSRRSWHQATPRLRNDSRFHHRVRVLGHRSPFPGPGYARDRGFCNANS